ncbi:hypothetical protein MSG28_003033, partial [Choristoneura fumiferana]
GTMMDKQLVWVRDPTDGFVLARIQELMGEEVDVLPLDNRHPRRVTNFDDLMFLNEATLLNNIVERYKKNKIYTYVANILLAVNPYRELADLYSSATIKRYQGKSLGELPPHSIIVSGESGAGKTESTKYILKYLCDLWAKGAGPVEQKILDANPILEAFGNAKTTRNNNSSRFGKFMEVHFSNKYQVVGGHISHYLLEKSRICTQSAEERNYHVFYLLCAGAPQDLRTALKITKPDDYSKSVYSVVAAVLHLGNVEFEEEGGARGGCHVAPGSEGSLATAAALLGVDGGELRMALVSRLMQSSRGGIKGTAIIFEQFCINYCNEKLQQFFNERILKNEQELYKREGLVSQFIEKNNDALHASLEFLVQESGCGLVQQLFRNTDNNNAKGKLNFISPNSRMVALAAEGALVLTQLQCNGTTAVLELMEHGFPSRAPFNDLHRMYAQYLPPRLQMLAPKVFAEFGLTRVFFRPGKYSEFDTIMRSDPDNLRSVIHKVLAWLVKSRWRRSIFAYRRQCLITIQTQVRGYLVRRRHRPRIRGVAKIRALEENLKKMETSNDKISSAEIDQLYSKLTRDVEERLRKIEAEMRAAEEAKRLEMERVRQEEENRRLKAEMEARRKAEEAERQRQEASDRAGAARLQQQLEHAARADQDNRERYRILQTPHGTSGAERSGRRPATARGRRACSSSWNTPRAQTRTTANGTVYYRHHTAQAERSGAAGGQRPRGAARLQQQLEHAARADQDNRERYRILQTPHGTSGAERSGRRPATARGRRACSSSWNTPRAQTRTTANGTVYYRHHTAQAERSGAAGGQRPRGGGAPAAAAGTRRARRPGQPRTVPYTTDTTRHKRSGAERQEASDRAGAARLQQQLEHAARADQDNRERYRILQTPHGTSGAERSGRRPATARGRRACSSSWNTPRAQTRTTANGTVYYRHHTAQAERSGINTTRNKRIGAERQEANDRAGRHTCRTALTRRARRPGQRERSERIRMQQAMQGKQKHDLSKWKYSELRDTINTSCDIELLEACRHEFHRRLKVYHAWKAKNARKTTMNEQERAPQSIMDAVIPKLELIEKLETWESNPDIIPSPKQRAGKKKCINPAVFQKTFLLLKPDIHIVAFREEVLWLRQVPFVRRKIEKKMAEINRDFKADVTKRLAGVTIRRTLPEKGLSAEEVTTGGTESIMMACKAFRDLAYSKGISNPQMVLPSTAHSAFDKAAQYLGLAVVVVKVNQETMTVDVDDVRRAIGRRTCLIVGSAPNFPYGTMDDINALSDLALECDVPLHVDACLGGFVAAFMPDAGHPVPYGFAPKGTSVVLYRKPEYRHCQYTVTTEWPGGVYGSPTVNGSRAGGLIAACWATMVFVGRSRYVTMADEILTRARTVIRLVCNFAPRGPAGELWLPAAPGAACPTHTQRDTQLPNLCNQANLTSNIGPSNDMTLKERSLLNAVLEIERNQLLEHPGSLDELYLTNMAIATLNHPVTTESYFKTTYKQDIIESTIFEDDKQIDKARNSIRETTKVISKMEHKNRRPKTTKLITRLSMVGRPKSYDVEELEDPYMEGYANTRSVETATLNEKDLYAEYEEQDISETTAEYDIKTTLKDAVVSTTMSISELELYSTGLFNSNDINNSYNISTTIVLVRPTHVNTFQEQPMDQAKQSDPTTEKWAGTLRRRDPDIQPTLPSIVSRKTSTASSMGSGRKTRSVERIPKTSRARQLVPIKPIPRKSDIPAEAGDVTIFEKDEKVFDATGYELHLVETLERDILQKNPDVRWRDVIGLDDAKSVLQEAMVLPLVMPDYFKAAFYAPSTIFLDEVDSLCAVRGADSEHEASRRFKAELLIQMDGLSAVFHRDKIIMVLAATNHPWDIDEAFRRRFEKRIYIGLPDETTRVKLLKLCLREVVLADDVDLKDLASKLDGYSGDAAMMTMRRKIAGKSPDQIRHLKRSELEAPISRDDLAAATDKTRRTVSQADVARYTGWMQRHGCS